MSDVNPLRRIRGSDGEAADSQAEEADRAATALSKAARGDESAFAEFYDLLAPLVHGVVIKVVRDPAMAEEVTQEVFVEVWRLAPRYDRSKGSARTWAATIAHRRAVDRVRSEQSRRVREQTDAAKQPVPHDMVAETVGDDLEKRRMRAALGDLSEVQREAVTLAFYGGHTYREVAALLNLPEGTIKTRIRDGLIRLRDSLGVTA